MTKNDVFHIVALIGIAVICLGIGYFFGLKSKNANDNNYKATKEDVEKISKISQEEVKIIEKELPEVYFFKINETRQCPKEYPIKAKFGDDSPVFYTNLNKFYPRVKPELCFTSKEKALEKGFLEKM